MSDPRGLDPRALRAARTYEPVPAPGAGARVWERVERERSEPWIFRVRFSHAAVAVACAAAFVFFQLRPPAEEPDVWQEVPAGRSMTVARASVKTLAPSTVRTPPVTDERDVVQLVDGALSLAVAKRAPGRSFVVETRHAIVRVVGTAFEVHASDSGTRVAVSEGIVEVTPRGGIARRLVAGQQVTVAPQLLAAKRPALEKAPVVKAPVEPEPEPEPAQARTNFVREKRVVKVKQKVKVRPAPAPTPAPKAAPKVVAKAEEKAPAEAETIEIPGVSEATKRLDEARSVVKKDARRAAEIATDVMENAPSPQIEADALAVLADASRRAGDVGAAARLYLALADHPNGHAYGEEALLRRALVLRGQGRIEEATSALERAHADYPNGPLAMERAALSARVALADGDPRRGAWALLRAKCCGGASVELATATLDVAAALVRVDRVLARRVLARMGGKPLPADLEARRRALLEQL